VSTGFEGVMDGNSIGVCQRGWGSSQYGSFIYSRLFRYLNRRNGANRTFSEKIGDIAHDFRGGLGSLGIISMWSIYLFKAIWVVKRAKQCE